VHFSNAFAADGYVYLVIGFREGIIVWDPRAPTLRPVMSWEQAPEWFSQHLGYYPQKEQITIVNQ
jgi:hypothetical protein